MPQPPDNGPVRTRRLEPRAAHPRPTHLRTDLALIVLSVIWGVNFSVIKIALREFDPLAFNGIRFVLASLTLFVFLRLSGPVPFPARRHWGRVVFLGLLANVVYQLLFIYGVDRTLAGNAGLVLATTPVWTLILASVSGQEHHGFPVWGGVLATLGGHRHLPLQILRRSISNCRSYYEPIPLHWPNPLLLRPRHRQLLRDRSQL